MWIIFLCLLQAGQLPGTTQETTITITPQRVSVPAFQYQLLPPLKERVTGNAVMSYYRCLAPDSLAWFMREKTSERSYAWLELPYEQAARREPQAAIHQKKSDDDVEETVLPLTRNDLSFMLKLNVLNEIDVAARRTHAEWEYLEKLKDSGFNILLPEVQGIRILSSILQIRARLQLMDSNYTASIHHLQSGLAMARHMNETNLVIGTLTGNSIARNMSKVMFEWIQQPGSPNLYWAISDLPRPYFDLRKAFAGDRLAVQNMFINFQLLNERILPLDEVKRLVEDKLKSSMRMFGNQGEASLTIMIARDYPKAKVWLKDKGWSDQKIESVTATQAALLYAYSRQELVADEFQKVLLLPPKEQLKQAEAISRQLGNSAHELSTLLGMFYSPSTPQILLSLYDLEREWTLMQCIEAIRHYAAVHDGKLPANWAAIADLSIPHDPFTGEHLGYEVFNDHAVITLPAIKSQREYRTAKKYKIIVNREK